MAISEALLARGQAVGLAPEEGESSQKFGARVRRAESASPSEDNEPQAAVLARGR